MKILNSKSRNFEKILDSSFFRRKNRAYLNSISVLKIIKDVKKKWR